MKKLDMRYIIAIMFPLLIGITSSFFSSAGMYIYNQMVKPPLSPPPAVFPVAWTILYLLMGTASYLILIADVPSDEKKVPFIWYLIQLIMNFFWPIIFFSLNMYMLALIWLVIMFFVIIQCTRYFFAVSPKAGWLMIPYDLWMIFALYLNTATALMNG